MSHDHLCLSAEEGFCLECARLEVIREDERYRVVGQIGYLGIDATRDDVIRAIEPVNGDPLRKKSPPFQI